jgi:signal transduction histidine kinase
MQEVGLHVTPVQWPYSMRPPTFVSRALARLIGGGLVVLALAWSGVVALERIRFGPDEAASRARVEAAVAESIRRLEDGLQRVIDANHVDAVTLRQAELGDLTRQSRLFDQIVEANRLGPPSASSTLYGGTAVPLAWVGRPVAIPDARLAGPDAVFLAPGALGLRFVRVHPVDDPGEPGRRAGALVLEAPLVRSDAVPDRYVLDTDLMTVTVRPRFEGAMAASADEFLVYASDGSVLAAVSAPASELRASRERFARRGRGALLLLVVALLLLASGPLVDWRRISRTIATGVTLTVGLGILLGLAYLVIWLAIGEFDLAGVPLVPAAPWPGTWFLRSPLHFLATSVWLAGLVSLVAGGLDLWRISRHGQGLIGVDSPFRLVAFLVSQALAASIVTAIVVAFEGFLRYGLAAVPADILHFGLRPWDWQRLAIVTGLVVLQATLVAASVVVLRGVLLPWTPGARVWPLKAMALGIWIAVPLGVVVAGLADRWGATMPLLLALTFIVVVAWRIGRIRARLRNQSQAARLVASVLALVLPSVAFYPSIVDAAGRARRALIEARFAPEVMNQRRDLQRRLADALAAIDTIEGLDDLVRAGEPVPQGAPPTDSAFLVWSQTDLAAERLTSSVELYNGTGALISRFALKLPDISGAPSGIDTGCRWDIFEEVRPFFAEERRLLHAGKSICAPGPSGALRPVGSIVVHLMLDYANLSFVSAQNPYVAFLRAGRQAPDPSGHLHVGFTVNGWSRRVLYSSTPTVAPLAERAFAQAAASRAPFWTEVEQAGRRAEAYVLNDRAGIYVLSTPIETSWGQLVVLAEMVTLASLVFLAAVGFAMIYGTVGLRTPTTGRALLQEVRASFYRKLFLAFVAATIVPVVALAFVTRNYYASLMFADIEMEATRTASVASRVVEDFGSLQVRGLAALPIIDDNIVVWLSRVIAQDVNIFDGPALLASSERNLFASGLLPTRTPGDMYRAILLDGQPSFVGREAAGGVEYLVAAAPVRVQAQNAILMVPLTSRQQEIAGQIEELDRRMLLAAIVFIMLGAIIGYSMAERIADPVNRLMRATRRIARGDLDARVLATSSDELQRLVEAFNRMADDLRRQRAELERTNRLAAWADMARQVAHDIKNPLTPIQLNAEHLLRVDADRGRPLGGLVQECVSNILGQVRLLRQIAAEFSSFATSPQPHPESTDLARLVGDIVEPYRIGLAGRVAVEVATDPQCPAVHVDPLLIGRALTNVIENALHAMPGGGVLRVTARPGPGSEWVSLEVGDTGVGMDAAALARIFEPYFSTKASGTGLGLTIAKRNVEASGGTVKVNSVPGAGTTVTILLPAR